MLSNTSKIVDHEEMAFYSRRRIQKMLDEVFDDVEDNKRKDLAQRLNNKRLEQSIPAEMEISLIWALKQVCEVKIEPNCWPTDKRPDCYTENLIQNQKFAIEITTLTDNSMSHKSVMEHCARSLTSEVEKIDKNIGAYLYFDFPEFSYRVNGLHERRIAAPKRYSPSESTKQEIRP